MRKTTAACALVALLAGPAAAQDSDWEFGATIYGWVPSLGASVDTAFGTIESDASGNSVLSNLDMAFMGVFEARNGPWSVIGDLLYSDLSASQPTPFGGLFSEAVVETKIAAFSGYLTYRVYETSGVTIDVGGGFRAFGVDLGVTLNPGILAGQSSTSSDSWVNPLLAGRIIVPFNDKWFGTAFVDFGGTGSDDKTWQALASVGYKFDDRWSMQLGYRQMDLTHDLGGNPATISMSGPIIGATFKF